jgi:hypothetical protein
MLRTRIQLSRCWVVIVTEEKLGANTADEGVRLWYGDSAYRFKALPLLLCPRLLSRNSNDIVPVESTTLKS